MSAEFIPVWRAVTPELAKELIDFWRDTGAIADEAAAKQRVQQVVCVARDGEGKLCGVGTAIIKVIPRLRQPMYYYRQFFAKTLRGKHQELAFFQRCKQVLQEYNTALAQTESLGILLEIENEKIAVAYKQAVIPGFDAVFIGYSPRGLQLRVSYFDNAELKQPVRPRTLPAAAQGIQIARRGTNPPLSGTAMLSGSITTEKVP
ncbi:MAG: hypothetical protein KUL77_06110 [Thermomonas sp.]|uniref:hypothetical protein n=1 Tax=Thermomonas sp. TaxID=1971895 RepID=UPI001EC34391|nr:hypothetical protein [Thermomonas sp.]MBV2209119.1 hypothetical protein [Thermomonas sp.]